MKAASAATFTPPEPASRIRVTSRDGVRLNVEVHGPQDARSPTAVLIHGWTCSIPFWAPVIRALRDDIRIVAYDLRGHGGSDIPDYGGYSPEALSDDLEAVLEQTIPAGCKAVLAGHSMGGMTIMAGGLRESVLSRTSGALLASTGAANVITEALALSLGGHILPFAALAQYWLLTSVIPLGSANPLSRAALSYLTLGPGASAELEAVNTAIIQACDPRPRAAWGYVLATLDVTAEARHLDVPVQVLVGTADLLTPPVHARRLTELLPCCEGLTQLPGIGHMTPLEAPEAVAGLIRTLAAARQS